MGSRYDLAIVTGGSSGIGKSIIERFLKLEPDAFVFNLSRHSPALFTNDENLRHLKCDLACREHRATVFDQLERSLRQMGSNGRILLVNNAGFGLYRSTDKCSPEEQLELLEVNVCALVELTTRLLPLIKQRGGSIMNIASIAAFQPTPFFATYGASKAFVLNWTLSLNEELRGSRAHAIAVCPGPTKTDFFARAGARGAASEGSRRADPQEVARLAFNALRRRKTHFVPGVLNKLMVLASGFLPLGLRTRVSGKAIRAFRKSEED